MPQEAESTGASRLMMGVADCVANDGDVTSTFKIPELEPLNVRYLCDVVALAPAQVKSVAR